MTADVSWLGFFTVRRQNDESRHELKMSAVAVVESDHFTTAKAAKQQFEITKKEVKVQKYPQLICGFDYQSRLE